MGHNSRLIAKIFNVKSLLELADTWKENGETLVFTNGCFDILHKGHIDYLSKAADLGTKLIVGLNTDSSVVRQNKSPSRPLQNESSRAHVLAALEFVDAVVLFDEDTPKRLIETILPQVLVKGADYKLEEVVGHEAVLAQGGKVELLHYLEGYSTTAIENKIKNS